MSILKNRIDFELIISVDHANPNGDPLAGNCPRENNEGYGMISDVAVKRKIRNRLQDMGRPIFIQSAERTADECPSLFSRLKKNLDISMDQTGIRKAACEIWDDVRMFGAVFAYSGDDGEEKADGRKKSKKKQEEGGEEPASTKKTPVSVGIRGPVSIHQGMSVDVITSIPMQITKSVNGEGDSFSRMSSDRIGTKYFVEFGVYMIKGSISPVIAEKTGFTEEDAGRLKEALLTLFVGDESAARPSGSMNVEKLIWWDHQAVNRKVRPKALYDSVKITRVTDGEPKSMDDYEITVGAFENLKPEILEPDLF